MAWLPTLLQLLYQLFLLIKNSKDPGKAAIDLHAAASAVNSAKTDKELGDALKQWQDAASSR